jgi:hypothetical protein
MIIVQGLGLEKIGDLVSNLLDVRKVPVDYKIFPDWSSAIYFCRRFFL